MSRLIAVEYGKLVLMYERMIEGHRMLGQGLGQLADMVERGEADAADVVEILRTTAKQCEEVGL